MVVKMDRDRESACWWQMERQLTCDVSYSLIIDNLFVNRFLLFVWIWNRTCRSDFLSVSFNVHFSWWTWVSRYQNVSTLDFIEAKDDWDGGDNWNYKSCKPSVKSSPPTIQHLTFYGPDALPVTQPTVSSTEGKVEVNICGWQKWKVSGDIS